MTPQRHMTVLDDVMQGAVQGDFAPQLGGAGRLAQVVCGFIPGVNVVCAIRDMIADHQQRDNLGAVLNAISIMPGVGGLSKIAAVIRAARRMGRAARSVQLLTKPAMTPVSPERATPPAQY